MKFYIKILIVLISSLIFFSCQKEDVYNPKKRLLSIFDYQQSVKTPFVSFIYNKDEKIEKAVFFDNSSFHFEYNEDLQVTKILGFSNNLPYGFVTMEYIDKKLSKCSYFNNSNVIFQMDTFYRQDGMIYGYKSYIAPLGKEMLTDQINSRLFQSYMHAHAYKNIHKILEDIKSGMALVSHTNVTYKDKNITQLETVYNNGFTTLYKFNYDDKENPLYGLPYALIDYLKFPSSPLTSYCKNNFIFSSYTEHYGTPGVGLEVHYDIVYENKKYPIQIYSNIGNETTIRWEFNYLK